MKIHEYIESPFRAKIVRKEIQPVCLKVGGIEKSSRKQRRRREKEIVENSTINKIDRANKQRLQRKMKRKR